MDKMNRRDFLGRAAKTLVGAGALAAGMTVAGNAQERQQDGDDMEKYKSSVLPLLTGEMRDFAPREAGLYGIGILNDVPKVLVGVKMAAVGVVQMQRIRLALRTIPDTAPPNSIGGRLKKFVSANAAEVMEKSSSYRFTFEDLVKDISQEVVVMERLREDTSTIRAVLPELVRLSGEWRQKMTELHASKWTEGERLIVDMNQRFRAQGVFGSAAVPVIHELFDELKEAAAREVSTFLSEI